MSYQFRIANITKFKHIVYATASSIAITAVFLPSLAMAVEDSLPTVEIHFEVLDRLVKHDPFQEESKKTPKTSFKAAPQAPANFPFSTKPSEPLENKPESKKIVKESVKAPVIKNKKDSGVVAKEPKPKAKLVETPKDVAPKIEQIPAPIPEPIAVPAPKMPELPIVPVETPKDVAPKIEQIPAPIPEPVAVPAPKMPELPIIPVETPKDVAPKIEQIPAPTPEPTVVPEDKKSPTALITPIPLPPTPDDEFAKALNAPNTQESPVPPTPEVKPAPVEPRKDDVVKTSTQNGKTLLSIKFISTETELPLAFEADLKSLAERVKASNERMTLIAYASESADQATMARRVSLSRVLAVRAFLIEQGVDKLNINVQAEGSKNDGGEPNRVDILLSDGKAK